MIVECVDDSAKPAEIPSSLWIKRKEKYTILSVLKDMNGIEYYTLEELDLASANTLYKGYASSRFRVVKEDEVLVEELVESLVI